MKKTSTLLMTILIASLALCAAAPRAENLARLTVWNRTNMWVYIKLTTPKEKGDLFYYFAIDHDNKIHVYTVERANYDIVYIVCGQQTRGIARIYSQLPLTFLDCRRPNLWYSNYQKLQDILHPEVTPKPPRP